MTAVLTEEQVLLKDMATAWARDRAPVTAFRRIHRDRPATGFDRGLWAEMVEMGWAGVLVPEALGGSDFGCRSLGLILEQTGRSLVASPLWSTALVAASAIRLGGSEAQQQRWLPAVAAGEAVGALALDEGPRHAPLKTALAAMPAPGGGWVLDGVKRPVADGMAADLAVVVARTRGQPGDADGITLFLVETTTHGLTRTPLDQVDARGAALYRFDGCRVGDDAVLGSAGAGAGLLDAVLDRGRAGLAAEMLGLASQAFETTLDYLKTRVQFGQVIGTFQALQHRAAVMFGELELARSAVEAALAALDADQPDAAELVSLAKAVMGETLHLLTNEMIQLHGGIGMTDEHDAGLYIKRARVVEASLGNAAYHRDRYGRLAGF